MKTSNCDVAILGSGLAGSVLGAILARQGLTVMLIDAGAHPRFAVGESTIPQFVSWLDVLAERYQIPEFRALTSIGESTCQISNTFGVKRHFGFMLHREGEEPNPAQSHQFLIPKALTTATHLFRQDSDAFMFRTAIKYGCEPRQGWRAVDVDFDEHGVTVTGHTGEQVRARYLVDASGFRSPLAEKFDLREKPARFKHHSRTIFSHMIGVRPFDDVVDHAEQDRPPARWHEGTMHHMFERGWFWVIPFDNYKDSRNPICSVGVTLDERLYPRSPDLTPEQEFFELVNRFPAVARQFEGARSVREWVSTDRLQYSSKQTVGDRWCLMSHAAGFIDPLFSRGLSNTLEIVNSLASRLIQSCADDDFSTERFEFVEKLEQGLLDYNDNLVNCSYISFSNFQLWDAVFRVWGLSSPPAAMRLTTALGRYKAAGRDDRHLNELEDVPYPGLWWPDSPALKHMFDTMVDVCAKYESGELDGDVAADLLFDEIQQSPITPAAVGWKDRDVRFIHPKFKQFVKFLYWSSTSKQPELRRLGRGAVRGIAAAATHGKKYI